MTWKRHFQQISKDKKLQTLMQNQRAGTYPTANTGNNFQSYLPEVYAGHPQRQERYAQYDVMDQDSEVNAALDTISDFSTRPDDESNQLFFINYFSEPNDSEVDIIKNLLNQWCNLNQMKTRLWRIFRNTLKYGDQFFIRDPETQILHYVDNAKVEKIIVDESKGKTPQYYVIRDLDLNLVEKVATKQDDYGNNIQGTGTNSLKQNNQMTNQSSSFHKTQGRFDSSQNASHVDAAHVVHFSLSEGLDANWPFGTSILEPIFKVFKQKELLEDSIVIYRVQRAPERRVFYVDVGGIPVHKSQAYLDKVKMEIHQRRIPTRTGGGSNIQDAAYNPLSIMEDYFFAQTADGRGSRVETLPGGENLGQIDDLKYFNNKMIRGLRVPSSYLPTGPEDGQASFNDGRVGTAYIQEYRFANYCQRLQLLLASVIEDEFKLFIKRRGYNIDAGMFSIEFNPPQNFRQFAQIERDTAQIGVFTQLADVSWLSKRFLASRFMGLSEEELVENERLWKQENPRLTEPVEGDGGVGDAGGSPGLDSVGFREPSEDLGFDDEGGEDDASEGDSDAGADQGDLNLDLGEE
ncbi:Bacteriophage T4-like capsid assembly protein (Gp20) [compost metagenome]